jgi:pyrrolidone-carboxylate peptidase
MGKEIVSKSLVFVIIGLFIWVSVVSGISDSKSVKDSYQVNVNLTTKQRVVMCTGFWNPTGLMITPFSTDPELNPNGWEGENWEGLGYDIYSYFPKPVVYTGMFEVDYQDTWEDFWNVTSQIHPIAIISFGAGEGPWEIEYNARNLDFWINDNKRPYQPTPCPPDDTESVDYIRHSSLPVQKIEDAVNNQTTIRAWVDWDANPGMYLCEYIAYLGMWYQNIHNTTNDLYPCRAAGFIHVDSGVAVEEAMKATKITIRETIKYLSSTNIPPDTPTINGLENGKTGEEYKYNFSTRDADIDNVYYFIDWGDLNTTEWLGPYNSGEEITAKHVWNEKGTYIIKAKAKDVLNAESDWATLTVSMPCNTIMNTPFMQFLQNFIQSHPSLFPILQKIIQRLGLQ